MTGPKVQTYTDLVVWQRSVELVEAVYAFTQDFPREETYGLSAQLKRAAVSIPSNIAEGSRRGSRADYWHFLLNAYGSGAELETQLEVSRRLKFGHEGHREQTRELLGEIMRMLNRMIGNMREEG